MEDLLSYYAETNRHDHYFKPGQEVEVYDDDEEEWRPLVETKYSLDGLLHALDEGLTTDNVRFTSDEAETYLELMADGAIERRLHDDEDMTRERLVGLAEAGYTSIDDLLAVDTTHVDIARESGVDENVMQTVAARYATGFSSASSLTADTGPFADVTPRDDFQGWHLTSDSEGGQQISWSTEGRYNLTLSATDGISLNANTPSTGKSAAHRKGRNVHLDQADISPEEGLQQAHDWLENHPVTFEDDLVTIPHVGPATADYLNVEFGLETYGGVQQFLENHPEKAREMFGDDHLTEIQEYLNKRDTSSDE